jgi:uncharacterized repeat protein (TIGR01451 family)
MLATLLPVGPAFAATSTSDGPLSVTFSSADSGTVNQVLPFTLSATNTTAAPFSQVQLVVDFPEGVRISGALPGNCVRAGGGGGASFFLCPFGALNPGQTVSIAFNMLPTVAGTLSMGGDACDTENGVTTCNSSNLFIPIAPAPTDVQVTGSASTGSPARGASFFYTFQVRNGGSQPAYGVTFSDTVPTGETLTSATASNSAPCTLSGGSVNCSLGDIAVGAQVLVTLNVIAPTSPATLIDTGSAADTNGDTQPSNNSFNVTVQVR